MQKFYWKGLLLQAFSMADESSHDSVWNAYINKHNSEPFNAQQLLNFSKNKANNVIPLSFSNARKTFNRNKGKGKIGNISSNNNASNNTDTANSLSPANKSEPRSTKSTNNDLRSAVSISTGPSTQKTGIKHNVSSTTSALIAAQADKTIDISKVTGQEIDILLKEIDENEVH